MTRASEQQRRRLDRLADALADDLFETSDEEILTEITGQYADTDSLVSDMNGLLDQALPNRSNAGAPHAPGVAERRMPTLFGIARRRARRIWAGPRRVLATSAAAAVVVLIGLLVGVLLLLEPWVPRVEAAVEANMAYPLPNQPSIAIIPFQNLSGDPDQDYLAEGIADTIITDLSRTDQLFVVARNSTFAYKGKPNVVKQVAEELGVQHVLEGSLQKSGDTVRVTARLFDALSGRQIWAQRYDRQMSDFFALQDDITANIIEELHITLTVDEQARIWGREGNISQASADGGAVGATENEEAFELYLRGRQIGLRMTRADLESSIELFERSLLLDPEFTLAHSALAWAHTQMTMWSASPELEEIRKNWWGAWEAFENAASSSSDKKVDLTRPSLINDSDLALALAMKSRFVAMGNSEAGVALAERAVLLAPGDPDVRASYAMVLSSNGQHERALSIMRDAYRLNPEPPAGYVLDMAWILFNLGRYAEAAEEAAHFQEIVPDSYLGSWILAPALAVLGRLDEARAELDTLKVHVPHLSIDGGFGLISMRMNQNLAGLVEGFRLAGAPLFRQGQEPRGELLTVSEIENLLYDQTITGRYFSSGIQWWTRQERGGAARRWNTEGVEEQGTFATEGDWACWVWNGSKDRKHCNRVYRRSAGTSEGLDQFLLAGTLCGVENKAPRNADEGIVALCPFSLDEASTD